MGLTHGSLFSGIGGFDLGFERVGITTLWQVECDPYALKVLEKHWPNVQRYPDITTIDWGTVPRPDILSGGFPCQDISIAGKGAGIQEGTRSGGDFVGIDFPCSWFHPTPEALMADTLCLCPCFGCGYGKHCGGRQCPWKQRKG